MHSKLTTAISALYSKITGLENNTVIPSTIARMDGNDEEYQLLDYSKHDIYLYRGIRDNSCKKEPETVHWIENHLKPEDILFDVGANIGAYSLITAKYHHGGVTVYAFEPSFQNFSILVKNIIKNECMDTVFPLNFPLDKKQKIAVFHYSSLNDGSALHSFGDPVDYKGDPFNPVFEQLMISFSIDDLVSKFDLPQPNHIKLDVDGIEFEILKGMAKTIKHDSFVSLLVEIEKKETDNARKIMEYLSHNGLKLDSTYQHKLTNNYIFVKR